MVVKLINELLGETDMPTVTIPDEVFERLAKRAAALNVTVEQLIAPLLGLAAERQGISDPTVSPAEPPFDEWKKSFDAWMGDVRGRAHRYPPGFVLDDSRESIYRGCGE
jgi:hypothetical protein